MIRSAELVEIDRIAVVEAEVARLRSEAYLRAGILMPARHERIATVLAAAATIFRTSTQMIVGPLRTKKVCLARNAVIWTSIQAFGVSSVVLGREIGGRDHSTILHSIARAEQWRRDDHRYRRITDLLLERFTPQSQISSGPAHPNQPWPAREETENAPRSH